MNVGGTGWKKEWKRNKKIESFYEERKEKEGDIQRKKQTKRERKKWRR